MPILQGIEERIVILSLGVQFKCIVPNFEVLAVNMKQAKVERESEVSGFDEQFDAFIRDDDESLPRCYPSYI